MADLYSPNFEIRRTPSRSFLTAGREPARAPSPNPPRTSASFRSSYSAPSFDRPTTPKPPPYRPPNLRSSFALPVARSPPPGYQSPLEPRQTPPRSWTLLSVFGDSYAGVFSLLSRRCVRLTKFKGASARGLGNKNSKLGVGQKLLEEIDAGRPKRVLLLFGHVDLFIVYLWQLKARGPEALRPAEWTQAVVRDYTRFVEEELLPRMGGGGIETLFIAGVTYPVVEDRFLDLSVNKYTAKQGAGPLPPLSRASHAHDIQTRRAMVTLFNAALKGFCARHNLRFVDINPYIVSPTFNQPNCVDPAFCDAVDPSNVHLLWERTIHAWLTELGPGTGLSERHLHQDADLLEHNLANFHLEKRERIQKNVYTRNIWRGADGGSSAGSQEKGELELERPWRRFVLEEVVVSCPYVVTNLC